METTNNNPILDNGSKIFERYQIISHLGQGGMGHVYKVSDLNDGSIFALKTLVPKIGKNAKAISRFKQEFSSMQSLNHPNIVRAFSFHEESENFLGFTMELVEGKDLDGIIHDEKSSLDINQKILLLEQIAQGLELAHKNNLIHRDLKPANILVSQKNKEDIKIKITDFGLAQQESDGEDMSKSSNQIGTAYYMSPEQHRGEELDSRTDIYSFGILAFELVTGQRPFDGSTPFKLFLAHVSQDIPNVRKLNPEIPKWLEVMIEICTEKSKSHRYPNMSQIVALFNNKTKKSSSSFFSFFK